MICQTCKIFFKKRTIDWRDKNKFCSSRCALVPCRTKEHQRKASKKANLIIIKKYRGTGTKWYVNEMGRHQHRIVMEKILGRKLRKGEIVHHKDGDKKNNRPSNLELCKKQADHASLHLRGAKRNRLGHLLKK